MYTHKNGIYKKVIGGQFQILYCHISVVVIERT